MLWQVHERHIAKSDFPQFPDECITLCANLQVPVKQRSPTLTLKLSVSQAQASKKFDIQHPNFA
jgi:hypothetical protein